MRYGRAVLLCLVIATGSCRRAAPAWVGEEQRLPGIGMFVRLPPQMAAHLDGAGVLVTSKLDTRTRPSLRLIPWETGRSAVTTVERLLANGAVLRYRVEHFSGGSGGDEEQLIGSVSLAGRQFAVECHDQAEWPGEPRAEWCLSIIGTLRP
jgi:hypothetical protein